MTEQTNCPADETLAAYIEGRLTNEEQLTVSDHLGACFRCYRIFSETAKDEAERSRKRKSFIYRVAGVAAAVLVFAIGLEFLENQSAPVISEPQKGTAAYWIHKYGRVSAPENSLVLRAEKVLQRLSRVADRSHESRLVFVGADKTPYAAALSDGSIVLTDGALHLCYNGVSPEHGDSRMAFVLGHELVHLRNRNFFHEAAFAAGEEPASVDGRSREKEREADAYGLIYATMAGFDPDAVLETGNNFIQYWVSHLPQQQVYNDRAHPGPRDRVSSISSHLKHVANQLNYFHFGVTLYQIGRYEDAIILLNRFAKEFPSREVFNNLGLCHYQLALQRLAVCDPALVEQAYPATSIDTESLAVRFRSAAGPTQCLENESFRGHIQNAELLFRRASEMDTAYLPSRINLSSTRIMKHDYSAANEILDEALKAKPGDSFALNNKALALYLSDPDQVDSSLSILKNVCRSDPGFAPAIYNSAVMLRKKDLKDSRETMRIFLQLESRGIYADVARKELRLAAPVSAGIYAEMPSPIPLSEVNAAQQILQQMDMVPFSLENLNGAFYENSANKVLVLEDFVEVVETSGGSHLEIASLQSRFGTPKRILFTQLGRIHVYSNFAVEIRDDQVHHIVHFE